MVVVVQLMSNDVAKHEFIPPFSLLCRASEESSMMCHFALAYAMLFSRFEGCFGLGRVR